MTRDSNGGLHHVRLVRDERRSKGKRGWFAEELRSVKTDLTTGDEFRFQGTNQPEEVVLQRLMNTV